MAQPNPRLSWDGTINVPTVISAIVLLVGGISFANAMSNNVSQLVNQVAETRNDVKQLKDGDIQDIKGDVSKINERLAALEERTRVKP